MARDDEGLAEGTNRAFWHQAETPAPQDEIWRLWTDPSTWKDWDTGLKDAHMDGAMQLGSKGKIVPMSGPASAFEVTLFTPGEHYAFTTTLPFAKLTVDRRFIDANGTTFRHDVSFSGLFGGFWAARFGPSFRAALPETMERLAHLAARQDICA